MFWLLRRLLHALILVAVVAFLLGRFSPSIDLLEAGRTMFRSFQRMVPTLAEPAITRTERASIDSNLLPRPDLTPGAVDPRVTQANIQETICRQGYAASVRPPFAHTNAMKHRLMQEYGATGSIHDYELDHLIPLELGGCPDCEANLWPQSRIMVPGAAQKDEVEDYLHRQVCLGAVPLAEAQREIARNWYEVYRKIQR